MQTLTKIDKMKADPMNKKQPYKIIVEVGVGDSTSLAGGEQQVVKIQILPNYNGNYRLDYDGKYITLFGEDKNYKGFKYDKDAQDWYEEMVLVAVVAECRNAKPEIKEVTDKHIVVALNQKL